MNHGTLVKWFPKRSFPTARHGNQYTGGMTQTIRVYTIIAEARTADDGSFGVRMGISPDHAEIPQLLERARQQTLSAVHWKAGQEGVTLIGKPYILQEGIEQFEWEDDDGPSDS